MLYWGKGLGRKLSSGRKNLAREGALLNGVVREGPSEKGTSEQRVKMTKTKERHGHKGDLGEGSAESGS